MTETAELIQRVKSEAAAAPSWADLYNSLFDPDDGLLTTSFATAEERAAFVKSDAFKHIRALLSESIDQHGLVPGATPRKSGRFVVRLPRSLHEALEQEALDEGVSLDQLAVLKLSIPLVSLVGSRKRGL